MSSVRDNQDSQLHIVYSESVALFQNAVVQYASVVISFSFTCGSHSFPAVGLRVRRQCACFSIFDYIPEIMRERAVSAKGVRGPRHWVTGCLL